MRAIKKPDSATMDGQRIYYVKPHQALDGKTPAEKAGINLQLEGNKWATLIKKASSK